MRVKVGEVLSHDVYARRFSRALGAKAMSAKPSTLSNGMRLADLVYELLKDSTPHLGIDLVRPPTVLKDGTNVIPVLFEDGNDCAITIEEL